MNNKNEGTQKQKKRFRYGLLRVMSFIIASAALAYKIFFAVRYFDSIEAWWNGNSIVLYFVLYMTSLAAVTSPILKGNAGLAASITVI